MTDAGPWDILVVLCKAAAYACTLGAAGAVFFFGSSGTRRLIWMLALGSMVFSIAKIAAMANSMSSDALGMADINLDRMILQTGEGYALTLRLAGLACVVTGAFLRRSGAVLASIGAAAAATSFAWVGHVRALGGSWLPLAIAVHVLAAAFWLGALAPLFISCAADVSEAQAAVSRFGAPAPYVVGALIAAGVCLLFALLGKPSELWESGYGRLMLLKMFLVACLLALGALNRWHLTPRLVARDVRAMRLLRRSIGIEIALAAGILLVTASLTTLVGPEPGKP
jgi:copper resistance protein D